MKSSLFVMLLMILAGWVAPLAAQPRPSDHGSYGSPSASGLGSVIVCESKDGRRRFCSGDLRGNRVSVLRNISREPCIEGQNYGYDERGVWVDQGCRAEFRIIAADSGRGQDRYGQSRDRGYNNDDDDDDDRGDDYEAGHSRGYADDRGHRGSGYDDDHDDDHRGGGGEIVRCASKDYARTYCDIGRNRGARLARQVSRSACDEGSSWGVDNRTLWVDDGCSGEFEIYR